jgi:hypothetical protein
MPVPGDGKEPGESAWLRDPVSVLSAIEGGFLGPSLRLIAIGSREIKITCRCPLSPRFFPVSSYGIFSGLRLQRLLVGRGDARTRRSRSALSAICLALTVPGPEFPGQDAAVEELSCLRLSAGIGYGKEQLTWPPNCRSIIRRDPR